MYYNNGETVNLDFHLGVNETIYGKDHPELRELGIEYIQCLKDDGWVYEFSYQICVNKAPLKILITDYEPDTYEKNFQTPGKKSIDFNSKGPGIQSIMVVKS